MATYSPSKLPSFSQPFLWIASLLALAFAWETWPQGHGFIILFVVLLILILYFTRGGMVMSQFESLASGKKITPAQTGF